MDEGSLARLGHVRLVERVTLRHVTLRDTACSTPRPGVQIAACRGLPGGDGFHCRLACWPGRVVVSVGNGGEHGE
jgi:hypothetical protein